ncbi:MAG: amidase [Chloroflexia bacterium]|nr:amidase [Chloroflexia bacterium]
MTDNPRASSPRQSRRRFVGLAGMAVSGAAVVTGVLSIRRGAPPATLPVPSTERVPPTPAVTPTRPSEVARATPNVQAFAGIEEASVGILGQALDRRQVSSAELVTEMVARIEAMDAELDGGDGLRALIELNPEAGEIAAALDEELAAGRRRGPLHGIPVLLKDTFATADQMHTTAGSLALVDNRGATDAFVVERLRGAGVIILGKTNLTEWSAFRASRRSSGWSGRGGQTRNPYQRNMSPWGSSSGSAVAVAASYAPLALGVETDGSIICPASGCGIVGFKPTVGLASRSGVVPISFTQDSPGPMARSVEDVALLLTAIAGYDRSDPAYGRTDWSAPASMFEEFPVHNAGAVDYTRYLDPAGAKGARVGICRSLFGMDSDADDIAEESLAALEAAGAVLVDDVSIPSQGELGADGTGYAVLLTEFTYGLDRFLETYLPDGPIQSLADIVEFNEAHPEEEMAYSDQAIFLDALEAGSIQDDTYARIVANNLSLAREQGLDAVMEELELDALVAPSAPVPTTIDLWGDDFAGASTKPTAMAGYPIITVPAGYANGLPVGLSFMGRAFSEPTLLTLASAFEREHPVRIPPEYRNG